MHDLCTFKIQCHEKKLVALLSVCLLYNSCDVIQENNKSKYNIVNASGLHSFKGGERRVRNVVKDIKEKKIIDKAIKRHNLSIQN